MTRTIIASLVVLSFAACKKLPPEPAPVEPVAAAAVATPMTTAQAVAKLQEQFARVQFEFDQSTLTADSKDALAANAAILQRHPRITVEVQGHADERGTTDYNVALGQKRAKAVQAYLTGMGVGAARVQTVSYGEEAPLAKGSTEVAWSANRRCEFRILIGESGVEGTTR